MQACRARAFTFSIKFLWRVTYRLLLLLLLLLLFCTTAVHVFNCSAGVCIHVREQGRALKVVEQLCTNVFTDGALMAHNPCCCCCYYFVQILFLFCYFVQKHCTYLIIAQAFCIHFLNFLFYF